MKSTIVTLWLTSALLVTSLRIQNCQVAFTSHSNGAVIQQYPVTMAGTADIPIKGHLWLLAHQVGFNGWYPQGNGETQVSPNKQWTCVVYLGLPNQNGAFEVSAVIVNDSENISLQNWVQKTQNGGPYYTIPFPNAFPGCSTTTITVHR